MGRSRVTANVGGVLVFVFVIDDLGREDLCGQVVD